MTESRRPEVRESFVNTYQEWHEPCTFASIDKVRDEITEILAGAEWITDYRKSLLQTGCDEMVTNAAIDAHRAPDAKREDPKESEDKFFDVSLHLTGDALAIMVKDQGEGFEPDTEYDPTDPQNLLVPSKRGLFLARQAYDNVGFAPSPEGTTVTLEFHRGGPKDTQDHATESK